MNRRQEKAQDGYEKKDIRKSDYQDVDIRTSDYQDKKIKQCPDSLIS